MAKKRKREDEYTSKDKNKAKSSSSNTKIQRIENPVPEYLKKIKAETNKIASTSENGHVPKYNQQLFNKLRGFQNNSRSTKSGVLKRDIAKILGDDSKIDINAQDEYGNTILHYAVLHRICALTKFLIENGASKDIANKIGETPNYINQLLADKNHRIYKIINKLLSFGIEDNSETKTSVTGYWKKIQEDFVDNDNKISKTPNIPNQSVSREENNISSNLINKLFNTINSTQESLVGQYWQMIDANKEDNSSVSIKNNSLIQPINGLFEKLYLFENKGANSKNFKRTVKNFLNKNSIDINAQDEFGNTVLHYAVLHKLRAIVELLIGEGASKDIANKINETPYSLCQRIIEEECQTNVSLLRILDFFNAQYIETKQDGKESKNTEDEEQSTAMEEDLVNQSQPVVYDVSTDLTLPFNFGDSGEVKYTEEVIGEGTIWN